MSSQRDECQLVLLQNRTQFIRLELGGRIDAKLYPLEAHRGDVVDGLALLGVPDHGGVSESDPRRTIGSRARRTGYRRNRNSANYRKKRPPRSAQPHLIISS